VTLSVVELDLEAASVSSDPEAFLRALDGPTVFRVRGRDRSRCRVIAGLLHGNEPSGLRAIHRFLATAAPPAVDLLCFLGAVEAARAVPPLRFPPGGRDLNRCFRPPFQGSEGRLAEEVLATLRGAHPEAVIDLHNNTGHNPAYGIGPHLDGARLALCALFARRYIHSHLRLGTFTEAFDGVAPALTIECGRAGDPAADQVAHAGLARFAALTALPPPPDQESVALFVEPMRICLRPGVDLTFAAAPDPAAHLTLDAEIDRHNFEVLPAGTRLGWVRPDAAWPLEAVAAGAPDQSRALFAIVAHELVARESITPVMMTTSAAAARADCLFYVVRRRP
jgi:hypothetical protein